MSQVSKIIKICNNLTADELDLLYSISRLSQSDISTLRDSGDTDGQCVAYICDQLGKTKDHKQLNKYIQSQINKQKTYIHCPTYISDQISQQINAGDSICENSEDICIHISGSAGIYHRSLAGDLDKIKNNMR